MALLDALTPIWENLGIKFKVAHETRHMDMNLASYKLKKIFYIDYNSNIIIAKSIMEKIQKRSSDNKLISYQ